MKIETKNIPPPPPEKQVIVTLSVQEARLLRYLCGSIGGDNVSEKLWISDSLGKRTDLDAIRSITSELYKGLECW